MIRLAIIAGVVLLVVGGAGFQGYRLGYGAAEARHAQQEAAERAARDMAEAAWRAAADGIERARLALTRDREARDAETLEALREAGGGDEPLDAFWRALDDRLR